MLLYSRELLIYPLVPNQEIGNEWIMIKVFRVFRGRQRLGYNVRLSSTRALFHLAKLFCQFNQIR